MSALQKQIFEMLMKSQHWHKNMLQDYQFDQLEQLVRHARQHTPFYSKRLDVLFRSDGTINWERWHDVPILTRNDLAQYHEGLLSNHLPQAHGHFADFMSSGTTGLPVKVRQTALAAQAWGASYWRAHKWWGLDWSRTMCHWPSNNSGPDTTKPDKDLGPWGNPDYSESKHGKYFMVERIRPTDERLEHLRKYDVSYLESRSNVPFATAVEANRMGIATNLKTIIGYSMSVEDEYRATCRKVFGAGYQAIYSSKEGGKIGYTCGTSNGYHICAEYIFVEILDEDGHPCPIGKTGRIVITPFLSSAQPLIRYDQGDLGMWGDACTCGVTLPVLSQLSGRVFHLFKFPGGRTLAPTIPDYLRQQLGALTWQFAQVDTTVVEVRYVPEHVQTAEIVDRIAGIIRKFFDPDITIQMKCLSEIPASPGGKYIKYVCELSNNK